jgi:hypothetical protein
MQKYVLHVRPRAKNTKNRSNRQRSHTLFILLLQTCSGAGHNAYSENLFRKYVFNNRNDNFIKIFGMALFFKEALCDRPSPPNLFLNPGESPFDIFPDIGENTEEKNIETVKSS